MVLNRTQLSWIIGNRSIMDRLGDTYGRAVRDIHRNILPTQYVRVNDAIKRRLVNALAECMGPTGTNNSVHATLMATSYDWTNL